MVQPGRHHVQTDASGVALVDLDLRVSVLGITASHPEARTAGDEFWGDPPWEDGFDIALERYDASDNPDYVFQDPGTPERNGTTDYCSHCHVTIVADWVESAHEDAAKTPVVHDLYAGTAAAFEEEAACDAAGGQWWTGLLGPVRRRAVLPRRRRPAGDDEDCGDTAPCDGVATHTGECANCHAPGSMVLWVGTTCSRRPGWPTSMVCLDVCHKISMWTRRIQRRGGGRIQIMRPSEDSFSRALGTGRP